jgi:hypothetical protein
MAAQDNKRENCQKKFLGLTGDHPRDQKYDVLWTSKDGTQNIKIELKTNQKGKSCTTKRRVTPETLKDMEDTVWIISEYDKKDPDKIDGNTIILFPEDLEQWRLTTLNRLDKGTPNQLGFDELKEEYWTGPIEIWQKIRKTVHKNDPHIGKIIIKQGTIVKSAEHLSIMLENYCKKLNQRRPTWVK